MILHLLLGAGVGAVLGFSWHQLAGCSSGTCPLTSHPLISTLYGKVVGALMAVSFH
jgi:hypothetical protein